MEDINSESTLKIFILKQLDIKMTLVKSIPIEKLII